MSGSGTASLPWQIILNGKSFPMKPGSKTNMRPGAPWVIPGAMKAGLSRRSLRRPFRKEMPVILQNHSRHRGWSR